MYWNKVFFCLLDRLNLNMECLLYLMGMFFFRFLWKFWEGLYLVVVVVGFFDLLFWGGFSLFCFLGLFVCFWLICWDVGWFWFLLGLLFVLLFVLEVFVIVLVLLWRGFGCCVMECLFVVLSFLFFFRLLFFGIMSVGNFEMFIGVVMLMLLFILICL